MRKTLYLEASHEPAFQAGQRNRTRLLPSTHYRAQEYNVPIPGFSKKGHWYVWLIVSIAGKVLLV